MFFNDHPIFLRTPLDVHIFGYILVHGAVNWQVEVSSSLDGLTSSLTHHTSSHGVIAGSIWSLRVYLYRENLTFNVEKLPKHVRHSITSLHVTTFTNSCSTSSLMLDILSLHNLKKFSLDIRMKIEDGYLIYGALSRISGLETLQLKFELNTFTEKGLQELCTAIANSCSLKLNVVDAHTQHEEYEVHRLVEAALSCNTITKLYVNILLIHGT